MKINESPVYVGTLAGDKKRASGATDKIEPDEEWRRRLRRAVKNTDVPADLRLKVFDLLTKEKI